MAQDDTIEDIIDRIERARDRCQNAADDQGVRDADAAIADLRSLNPSALPTAHDVEDYFNERTATRATRTKGPRDTVPAMNEPVEVSGMGLGATLFPALALKVDLSDDS